MQSALVVQTQLRAEGDVSCGPRQIPAKADGIARQTVPSGHPVDAPGVHVTVQPSDVHVDPIAHW